MNAQYTPIMMTGDGEFPVAVLIDFGAFLTVQDQLNSLQAARDAGEVTTPEQWVQFRNELIEQGYAQRAEAVA